MLYAEWSGTHVSLFDHTRRLVRKFNARANVVGVQVSGDGSMDAKVAITMCNGKTDLYASSGVLIRKSV